jgi:hypothetical protein
VNELKFEPHSYVQSGSARRQGNQAHNPGPQNFGASIFFPAHHINYMLSIVGRVVLVVVRGSPLRFSQCEIVCSTLIVGSFGPKILQTLGAKTA